MHAHDPSQYINIWLTWGRSHPQDRFHEMNPVQYIININKALKTNQASVIHSHNPIVNPEKTSNMRNPAHRTFGFFFRVECGALMLLYKPWKQFGKAAEWSPSPIRSKVRSFFFFYIKRPKLYLLARTLPYVINLNLRL